MFVRSCRYVMVMYHSINGIPASFTIPKVVLKMYNVLGPMSPEKSPVLALESPGSISLALHDTCGPPQNSTISAP